MTSFDHPMFDWQHHSDGVVVLTMNDPDHRTNTANERFVREFPAVLARLEAERDSITGVVLTSGKKTFFAGADLTSFVTAGPDQIPAVESMLNELKTNLRRLETFGRPVVAAINGAALGGGYEIALACHYRVVVDDPNALVGLPESTLGLLAGAGGTVRTVRMFGIQKALTEFLWPGTKFSPVEALPAGLVDELVTSAGDLVVAAKRWIASQPEAIQPWDKPGYLIPGGAPSDRRAASLLSTLPAALRKKTRGAPDPAAEAILAAVVEGAQVDFVSAQAIESRYCAGLVGSQISSNIIKAKFFDPRVIRRATNRPAGYPQYRAARALIVGTGPVTGGIAYACAAAGIDVAVAAEHIADAESVKAHAVKLLEAAKAEAIGAPESAVQVTAWTLDDCPGGADVLIESVFDDGGRRQQLLAAAAGRLGPDTLVLSNSSAIPIATLADKAPAPENVVGMHFFAPVEKMALVEIAAAERASDETLAKAIDFARQLGKTAIVVGDGPGFFTTRILEAYIDEALRLLVEGIPASSIEQGATQSGYPTGVLALVDDLGLPVMSRISDEIADTFGRDPSSSAAETGQLLQRLVKELERTGRADGTGFYDYHDGRRNGLWVGLSEAVGAAHHGIDFVDLKERLLFREVLEAIRCFEEGVVRTVPEANVGSILGVGFPGWTGGVLQFANQYEGGLPGFVSRCQELELDYGPRFQPSEALVALSEKGGRYE
ncbi:enoyl-CoA hydratase-related protein [Nocardia sp. NPDC059246]|uniref:enoyl-CoA hydratase-related protein n=1 Tax=unclassified Nocardia TaxID=2637762 RepID=UPI0036C28024